LQDVHVCQKKVWNEWDSLFFSVRRNLCAMRVVNSRCQLWLYGGLWERLWKLSPITFTCCSFFTNFGTLYHAGNFSIFSNGKILLFIMVINMLLAIRPGKIQITLVLSLTLLEVLLQD
jgi:hypothetical protein